MKAVLRVAVVAGVLGGVVAVEHEASAQEKILLVQRTQLSGSSIQAAQTIMTQLGYDVTAIGGQFAAVPANVTDYAQVYVLSDLMMLPADGTALVSYVQGGGRLFVTAENELSIQDHPQNVFVQDKILKPLLSNSTNLVVGPPAIASSRLIGLDVIPEATGFGSHPNQLSKIWLYSSGFVSGIPDANVFLKDPMYGNAGAVWTRDDLVQGSGCVMLIPDVDWWVVPSEAPPPPPVSVADVTKVVENVHDFLKYCGDHDFDGILDTVEVTLGTDPATPDSDGDGLCDGTIAVNNPAIPTTCIAGENAKGGQKTAGPMIDALNPDDDGDGIPTKTELADSQMFGTGGTPWLNLDSDGDGVPDKTEGRMHFNMQGLPDYLDPNYPTPQPTSSTSTGMSGTAGTAGTSSTGSGAASGGAGGNGAGGGSDGGGCNCFVGAGEEPSSPGFLGAGLFVGALVLRSRRRRAA